MDYVDRRTIEESGFPIRMIWFLILISHFEQNFYDFGGKISTGMSILQSPRRKEQHPEKHLFFRINYQFHFILGFWGLLVWTFSEKKIRTFRTAFNASGGKIRWKMFFFGLVKFFRQFFGLLRNNIGKFS